MLMQGSAPLIISEQLSNQTEKLVPSWPKELADYTDPQKLQQKALEAGTSQVQQQLAIPDAVSTIASGGVNAAQGVADVKETVMEGAAMPTNITEAAAKVTTPAMLVIPAVPAEIK